MKKLMAVVVLVVLAAGMAMAWDGRCPICVQMKKKSKVQAVAGYSTKIPKIEHWDEKGKKVVDNPNTNTVEYRCTLKHIFTITRRESDSREIEYKAIAPKGYVIKLSSAALRDMRGK